jgi:hypothetical protein
LKLKFKRFAYIILLSATTISPLVLAAQSGEFGRLSLAYQGQILNILYPGDNNKEGYFSFLNNMYFDFRHHFAQGGELSFSLNYYFSGEFSRVTSYNLGFHGYPLGSFQVDVDLGYLSYPLSSLSHLGSFNPFTYRSLKGGKITLRSKAMDFIVFGGQDYTSLGFGDQNNRIYGAKAVFRPTGDWTVGAGWMKISNANDDPGTGVGTSYDIFSLDSSLQLVNGLYLLGDFRFIPGSDNHSETGFSFKTGTYFNRRKLSFEIFYNYISPDFPYLGSMLLQARKGLTVMGQYQAAHWLSLFGGWDTYNEDLGNILENTAYFSDYMTYRGGVVLSPKTLPHLSISLNSSKRETGSGTAADPQVSNTAFDMVFLSLSRQYRRFYWSLYFNKGDFQNRDDIARNYSFDRLHLNLYRFYWSGSSLYFNGYLERKSGEHLAFKDENVNLQVGSNLKLSSRLGLNLELSGNISKDKISRSTNRQWSAGASIFYKFIPLGINCALRYRYANARDSASAINIGTYETGRYMHQVFFSISKDFSWGRGTSLTEAISLGLFTRKAKIKGCVFVDIDQNQRKAPDEEGLGGIFILLDGRKIAKTNRQGNFTLTGVSPGTHRISMDLRNVPAFYEADREKVEVVLKKGETRRVDLTVIPMALISGKLVLDINENNLADKDEPVITGERIDVLKEGKLYQSAFTDTRGVFTFANLRPGTYIVAVAGDVIKETYSPGEKSALEITVKPWEEKRGLVLLVTKYKKPKIKRKLN